MTTKRQNRRPRPHRGRGADGTRVARALGDLVPSTALGHLRQARREVLLAVRDVLDHVISRAEGAGRPRRLRRVKVE